MREKPFGCRTTLPCLLFVCFALALPSGAAYSAERIPITTPAVKAKQMPQVFFNHDAHMAYVEGVDGDCSTCHNMTDAGLSESLKDVTAVPAAKQVEYMHATCTACHVKAGKGPRLVSCRTCHSETIASEYAGKQ